MYLKNYVTAFLIVSLGGAALGFLRFNFHPAKIFMGDAGSMLLGLIFASASLLGSQYKSTTAAALLIPFTALSIPISDTLVVIIRRMMKKTPVFKADKKHLHHRLIEMGLTQNQIVLMMGINGISWPTFFPIRHITRAKITNFLILPGHIKAGLCLT